MARSKRKKIFIINHHRYGEVQVYFNAEEGAFSADVYTATVRAESKDKIVRAVYAEIEARQNVEWRGVIEVKKLDAWGAQRNIDGSFVGFEIERYWVARRQDGKWLRANWFAATGYAHPGDEPDEDSRFEYAQISLCDYSELEGKVAGKKSHPQADREEFYLPYSDGLWDALQDIIGRITELDSRLTQLLSTPGGIKQLMAKAGLLITDGKG